MNSLLSITVFVVALVSSVLISNTQGDPIINSIYVLYNTSNCVFPFNYNGKSYTNCTLDGTNGNRPWCSLTTDYYGLFTQCQDVWSSTLKCAFPFTLNGVKYNNCIYFNRQSPFKQCFTNNPDYPVRYCIEDHVVRSNQKLLHPGTCDPGYRAISDVHTMCAGPYELAFPKPISDGDKQDLIDLHNSYRAAGNATNMVKMYWDDDLAQMAQVHANMCAFDHDLANNRLSKKFMWKNGQNMLMVNDDLDSSPADLFAEMFDAEEPHFVYGVGCNPDGSCTHYTQMMLNDLTRFGCGQTYCLYPETIERFVVCNYIKSQYSNNYMIPYIQGAPCSACPHSKSVDPNTGLCLCDCKNAICNSTLNQVLNMDTCQCQSSKRSVEQDELVERNTNDQSEVSTNPESLLAVPGSSNIESKRDLKRIPGRHSERPHKRNQYEQDQLVERNTDGQSEVITNPESLLAVPGSSNVESKRDLKHVPHRPHKRNQWQDKRSFADGKRDLNIVSSRSSHEHGGRRPDLFPTSTSPVGWKDQRRQVADDIDAMVAALEANMEDK